jgi:hypothetical protein
MIALVEFKILAPATPVGLSWRVVHKNSDVSGYMCPTSSESKAKQETKLRVAGSLAFLLSLLLYCLNYYWTLKMEAMYFCETLGTLWSHSGTGRKVVLP